MGTAYHCEINRVSRTMLTKVPEELTDYRQAAFCALGGIALEGIHQAEVVPERPWQSSVGTGGADRMSDPECLRMRCDRLRCGR